MQVSPDIEDFFDWFKTNLEKHKPKFEVLEYGHDYVSFNIHMSKNINGETFNFSRPFIIQLAEKEAVTFGKVCISKNSDIQILKFKTRNLFILETAEKYINLAFKRLSAVPKRKILNEFSDNDIYNYLYDECENVGIKSVDLNASMKDIFTLDVMNDIASFIVHYHEDALDEGENRNRDTIETFLVVYVAGSKRLDVSYLVTFRNLLKAMFSCEAILYKI